MLTADALMRVLAASPEGETPPTPELRSLLRQDLAERQGDPDFVHHGVSADIRLDGQGNALTGIEVGVYEDRDLVSAPVQLQIDAQSANGDLRFSKLDVVFVGVDLAALKSVSPEQGIFEAEMLLSLRQRTGAEGADIIFTNAVDPVDIGSPILAQEENGMRTEVYRFEGTFTSRFDFTDFPFDSQALAIDFIHSSLGTDRLQYALEPSSVDAAFRDGGDLTTSGEWRVRRVMMATTADNLGRGLGALQVLLDDSFERSGIQGRIILERDRISAGFKNLFPIVVVVIMLYLSLFLPLSARGERVTVAVSSILAIAFFSTGASNVARPGHFIAMDYLFLTTYALSFVNLGLTVVTSMDQFDRHALYLNRYVVWGYPVALALGAVWFIIRFGA
jgi:hypothetical protein